jgi:hypothetical protein
VGEHPDEDRSTRQGALLGGAFRHVETTYNRNADDAEVAAYYRLAPKYDPSQAEHAESLLAVALGAMPYRLRAVTVFPWPTEGAG